jgi:hypothetical protein
MGRFVEGADRSQLSFLPSPIEPKFTVWTKCPGASIAMQRQVSRANRPSSRTTVRRSGNAAFNILSEWRISTVSFANWASG